jgi:hypothetical protein
MARIYLPNNNFLDQWRALSLDEMKAQPAFQAVLDYYRDKGHIVPVFGTTVTPGNQTVVTFKFTDINDAGNVIEVYASDAICSPYPTLGELRRHGISKTSPMSYDPFNWAPPEAPKLPPPVGPLVLPNYVVGDSYDGGLSYMNMGPIPYVGAETTDARGTFVAMGHATIGGSTFYWVPKAPIMQAPPAPPTPPAAPVNPFAGFTRDQLMAFLMQALAGAK